MTKIAIVIAFALAIILEVAQNAVINRANISTNKHGKSTAQKVNIISKGNFYSTMLNY